MGSRWFFGPAAALGSGLKNRPNHPLSSAYEDLVQRSREGEPPISVEFDDDTQEIQAAYVPLLTWVGSLEPNPEPGLQEITLTESQAIFFVDPEQPNAREISDRLALAEEGEIDLSGFKPIAFTASDVDGRWAWEVQNVERADHVPKVCA